MTTRNLLNKIIPNDLTNIIFEYLYEIDYNPKRIMLEQLKSIFNYRPHCLNILYNINFPRYFIREAKFKIDEIKKILKNEYQINYERYIEHMNLCKKYIKMGERRFRKKTPHSKYYPTGEYFDYSEFHRETYYFFLNFILEKQDLFEFSHNHFSPYYRWYCKDGRRLVTQHNASMYDNIEYDSD